MSKRHYIAIAQAVRECRDVSRTNRDAVEALAKSLAAVLAADNPRFDVTRFMTACGFGGAS
jgi:hypothetical protein